MQQQFEQQIRQKGLMDLVDRQQMLVIAKQFNLFVTKSTIHRWANAPDFPYAVGQDGRSLLYKRDEFVEFLKKRIRQIREDR